MNEPVANEKRSGIISFSKSIFSKFIFVFGLLTAGIYLFTLTGRFFFLAELACNFRFQIMLTLAATGILSVVVKRYRLACVLAFLTLLATSGTLSMYYPISTSTTASQTLKIMSFNVLVINRNYQAVIDEVAEHDPDVVTIIEYSKKWDAELKGLQETYPYSISNPRPHGFGVAIFSKYPLSDVQERQLPAINIDNPFLSAVVSFDEQTIRLAAVHTYSPTSRARMSFRNQQFTKVAELLGDLDMPTVVVGDFNCTPWSPYLKDFQAQTGLRDSRRGFGNQATWPTQWKIFRIPIDHAFVSPEICVHDRYVGNATGSDHLPIIVEVSTETSTR
ncbi:MAG: endonuclease/exonuclease/phosphatase family protein [Mariniblastus sp.]|nr:endonuclease/exonuclease/phosphatase family protein [Mariniblastus sp.]